MNSLYGIFSRDNKLLAAATSEFLANVLAREHYRYEHVTESAWGKRIYLYEPQVRELTEPVTSVNIEIFGTGYNLVPRRASWKG